MARTIITEHTFESGVHVSVHQDVHTCYPGNAFEPPDVAVIATRLYVNDREASADKHRDVVDYVLEHGRA